MPAAIGADFSRAFYPGGMKMRLFLKMVSVSAAAAQAARCASARG